MIIKHVAMRSLGKSDFGGLVNYITDAQSKEHRLGQVQITNCDAESVPDAIFEVLATQHMNTRAKGDKTYHLIVSFRAGEQPSDATLHAIEDRICVGLGYGEHQRISAIHKDTDNLHIHIAINKIHPVRHTMHEPYYPHRTLAELGAILEREYGLERDNHETKRSGAEGRAADMERHAGVESLIGWIKRECLDAIKSAQSWQELHQVMHDNGLELRERANGLVIEANDGTMVKASSLARDFSKNKLEARFDAFEAALHGRRRAKRRYQKDPIKLRVNTVELYANYKNAQQDLTVHRAKMMVDAKDRKNRAVESAKKAASIKRAAIKCLTDGRLIKRALYSQVSSSLQANLASIHNSYAQERQEIYQTYRRRAWADWLKDEALQGDMKALAALRAREAAQGLQGNTVQAQGRPRSKAAPTVDNITKKGTIIFRAGKSAIRDDGDKLQVSRGATSEGIQAALQLAIERYGNRITVNGTDAFKADIIRAAVDSRLAVTFADPSLETKRQELLKQSVKDQADGIKPRVADLAADKYIAEREEKRQKGMNILKHVRYTFADTAVTFKGIRNVDGQTLALLGRGDEIMVMPVDQATAKRLARLAIGEVVTMTPRGGVQAKGKGR